MAAGAAAAAAARVRGRVYRGKLLPRHRGPADRPRAQAQRDLHLRPEGARAVLHRGTPGGETHGVGGWGGQRIPGLFLVPSGRSISLPEPLCGAAGEPERTVGASRSSDRLVFTPCCNTTPSTQLVSTRRPQTHTTPGRLDAFVLPWFSLDGSRFPPIGLHVLSDCDDAGTTRARGRKRRFFPGGAGVLLPPRQKAVCLKLTKSWSGGRKWLRLCSRTSCRDPRPCSAAGPPHGSGLGPEPFLVIHIEAGEDDSGQEQTSS